jgi:hypothetical protein
MECPARRARREVERDGHIQQAADSRQQAISVSQYLAGASSACDLNDLNDFNDFKESTNSLINQ